MKRRKLSKVGIRNVYIEGLALIDESSTIGSHLNQLFLLDLPHSLVDCRHVKAVLVKKFLCDMVVKLYTLHSRNVLFASDSAAKRSIVGEMLATYLDTSICCNQLVLDISTP